MSTPIWHQYEKIVIPAGAAGQVTGKFAMPQGVFGCTIWVPALSANVNFTIQALQPKDGDQDADSWASLSCALTDNAGAVRWSTVSGLGTTTAIAYGFDGAVLGAGTYRLITTGAGTQAAAATAYVSWRSSQARYS